MTYKSDPKTSLFSRRDFLKTSGLITGSASLGPLIRAPLVFAKDIYPADKITLLVPAKAGGGRDLFARAIAPYISKYLKEIAPGAKGGGIQIKNDAAGGGRKAYSTLFNAKPDGYTLGITETSAITDSIIVKPEYDFNNLTFLLLSFYSTKMIVTHKKGFGSWSEVAAAMKKGPVKMSVSTFAGSNHIAGIIMNEKAKTNFKIIVFPGTAESENALLRGDTSLSLLTENAASGLLEAGEVKVLLELTNGTNYPGAVSLKELGVPEIAKSMNNSQYIVAPPNLTDEPREILIEAIKRATNDKEFEAWAKKFKLNLGKTYGDDAAKLYQGFAKYYEEIAPILIKHLK